MFSAPPSATHHFRRWNKPPQLVIFKSIQQRGATGNGNSVELKNQYEPAGKSRIAFRLVLERVGQLRRSWTKSASILEEARLLHQTARVISPTVLEGTWRSAVGTANSPIWPQYPLRKFTMATVKAYRHRLRRLASRAFAVCGSLSSWFPVSVGGVKVVSISHTYWKRSVV